MELQSPRKRATPYAAAQQIAARKIVQPYEASLSEWNSQFAMLRAVQGSSRGSDISVRATQLVRRIAEVQSSLRDDLKLSDEAVASHSLVRDFERAMSHLSSELEKLAGAQALAN